VGDGGMSEAQNFIHGRPASSASIAHVRKARSLFDAYAEELKLGGGARFNLRFALSLAVIQPEEAGMDSAEDQAAYLEKSVRGNIREKYRAAVLARLQQIARSAVTE
jgi:hypothetical protein